MQYTSLEVIQKSGILVCTGLQADYQALTVFMWNMCRAIQPMNDGLFYVERTPRLLSSMQPSSRSRKCWRRKRMLRRVVKLTRNYRLVKYLIDERGKEEKEHSYTKIFGLWHLRLCLGDIVSAGTPLGPPCSTMLDDSGILYSCLWLSRVSFIARTNRGFQTARRFQQ